MQRENIIAIIFNIYFCYALTFTCSVFSIHTQLCSIHKLYNRFILADTLIQSFILICWYEKKKSAQRNTNLITVLNIDIKRVDQKRAAKWNWFWFYLLLSSIKALNSFFSRWIFKNRRKKFETEWKQSEKESRKIAD